MAITIVDVWQRPERGGLNADCHESAGEEFKFVDNNICDRA